MASAQENQHRNISKIINLLNLLIEEHPISSVEDDRNLTKKDIPKKSNQAEVYTNKALQRKRKEYI